MPQKSSAEDIPFPKPDKQDNSRSRKTKVEAGDKSNVGVASDFEASGNSTVNIGSTITNNFSKSACQFFRLKNIDLQSFDSPFFPNITRIDDILKRLKKYRILLLGGTHEDKQEIAIHVAAKLKQELQSESAAPNSVSILKWNSSSDYKGILAEIRGEEDERTDSSARIIILPDMKPDYIAFDIDKINQAIHGSQCYVIADTDNPLQDWAMKEPQKQKIWWDTTDVSYQSTSLAEASVQRLIRAEINLDTVEDYLRQQIINLNTVARVKDCIQWLRNEKQPLSQDAIDQTIFKAKQDRRVTLERWFRHELKSREQLLVIGVTLFKNLFSNQLFSALERVVEQTWQKRETSLRSLDYSDLELLGTYCELISGSYRYTSSIFKHIDTDKNATEFEVSQVKLIRPDEASFLFEVAWNTHQRQIINALKEMAQMVKDSIEQVYKTSSDWELFGDEVQSKQLRAVVGQTLGEIGLVSLGATNAVQNMLLSLAAHNSIEVRDVAAQAIASWYPDKDRKFYETLLRLYSIAVPDPLNSTNIADYIGATVAMTVSYGALSDLPDHLSEHLVSWLKELAESKSLVVRGHLGYHTLAFVIPRHLQQLRGFLKGLAERYGDLSEDEGLGEAIALSLNRAYKERPEEVLELVQSWFNQCQKNRSRNFKVQEQARDRLVKTVALTYGAIECKSDAGSLTPEIALAKLAALLKEERHPKVRDAVVKAICDRASKDFSSIESQMKESLVAEFTQDERSQLVRALTGIYLQQRESLEGSQDFCRVGQRRYPVWISGDRPLTAIEAILLKWLGNRSYPIAQQVAIQAEVEFARVLGLEEERHIEFKRQLERDRREQADALLLENNARKLWKDMPLAFLYAWLATLQRHVYQPIVCSVLPEAFKHYKERPEAMNSVLRKWKGFPQQNIGNGSEPLELKPTVGFLQTALKLAENKHFVLAGGVGLVILAGLTVVNTGYLIANTVPVKSPQLPSEPEPIDPGIIVQEAASISDVDSTSFGTGRLTVKFTANATLDDRLGIRNQGKGQAQIGVDGNQVTYGGTVIGQFEGGQGTEPLVVSFNSNATPEAVQALMRNTTYHNVSPGPVSGSRTVEFQALDGAGGTSRPLSRTVFVTRGNAAPTLAVPVRQAVSENTFLKISGISINDSDSTKNLTVTLSVNNGTITIKDSVPKGLTADEIGGNNSKTVKLTGSLEKIQATFADSAAVAYKGTNDDSLNISVNDGGQDIPGGAEKALVWPPKAQEAKTISKEIQIAVSPNNKIPILTISKPNQAVNEDEDLALGGIGIDDPDTSNLTVTLKVEQGTLSINTKVAKGLEASAISGNKTGAVTLKGDRAQIQATLADPKAITYRGNPDFNGNDSLAIAVDDGGRGKADKLNIVVNSVNDPPVLGIATNIEPPQPQPNPPAPEPDDKATNATVVGEPGSKNVRSGPGTNYGKSHTASPGDRVRVTGEGRDSDNYLWYKVYFPKSGAEGWIAAQLIKLDAETQLIR